MKALVAFGFDSVKGVETLLAFKKSRRRAEEAAPGRLGTHAHRALTVCSAGARLTPTTRAA
jgi:hypothetical protein